MGSNLESTTLFTRDALDAFSTQLSDTFIRKNLRYLAPEVAGSRQPSLLGHIYSFGVMAYELFTGTTIDGGPDSPAEADVDVLIDIHRHLTIQLISPLEHMQREAEVGAFEAKLMPQQLSDIIMRCLEKNEEDRYSSLDALACDMAKLAELCNTGDGLKQFVVGEIDLLSRFMLPEHPIQRDAELEALDRAFAVVAKTSKSAAVEQAGSLSQNAAQVLNLWAPSGGGKTRLVDYWTQKLETSHTGHLLGYAKLDERSRKPLSSFVQIFQSLLDRVLTDPKEDATVWNKAIVDTLGNQYPLFLSLLSNEARRLVTMGTTVRPVETPDVSDVRTGVADSIRRRILSRLLSRESPQWCNSDNQMVEKTASIICLTFATTRCDRGRHSVATFGRGEAVSHKRTGRSG